MELKLFVWTEFEPDYTDGLAFAIAETEEEAKELVIKEKYGSVPRKWGNLEILSLNEKTARSVEGGG